MLTSEQGQFVALDADGVKIADKDGNIVSLGGGDMQVIAKGTVHLVAPSVNLKGGSIYLGDGAAQSAVLGELFQVWAK